MFCTNLISCYFAAEPEHAAQVEPISKQPEAPSKEKEDVKPQILSITETHLPIYHSEQHYPVLVKTEDLHRIAEPVVISEEKPPVERETLADNDLPVRQEQQSYVQEEEEEEEAPVQEEIVDGNVVGRNQEQSILHSREEITSAALYEPGNIDEQMQEEQIQDQQVQDEQIEEEQIQDEQIQEEQIQEEKIQDEQIQDQQIQDEQIQQFQEEVPDVPLPDQERFASERHYPAEDSSAPSWMQESAPVNAQEPDEFYTPEEQVIPQSHAYPQEYQEESYEDNVPVSPDSHEPWVMVDYPPAEEQENNYLPAENNISESHQEMPQERFAPQVAEEEAEYQYYDDEQRIDNEELDEPQPVEVSTVSTSLNKHPGTTYLINLIKGVGGGGGGGGGLFE